LLLADNNIVAQVGRFVFDAYPTKSLSADNNNDGKRGRASVAESGVNKLLYQYKKKTKIKIIPPIRTPKIVTDVKQVKKSAQGLGANCAGGGPGAIAGAKN